LSKTETLDLKGLTSLKAIDLYLQLVALNVEKNLIAEQLSRAEIRLKNINSLYQNQKVTRSDLLRAEVNLSDVKLSLEETSNNMVINRQRLSVILNLPENTPIVAADSSQITNAGSTGLDSLNIAGNEQSYAVRKAQTAIQIEEARGQKIKSNNLPSVSLFGTYYMAYPNTLPYPHVDQAYSLGYVGIGIQYNLSAIYQNKYKLTASKTRTEELQIKKQSISDDIRQEQKALIIKYGESLNRIKVNEQSIEQARVNYKIVNTKYLNQLALLTDLLDADNIYQETRYKLVEAEADARSIYYRLLYLSGNL
jgi:outer membrane protein TolC